jgi:hypothetical protein
MKRSLNKPDKYIAPAAKLIEKSLTAKQCFDILVGFSLLKGHLPL